MTTSLLLKIRTFLRNEDGAVTVDWVALTAGVLLFGLAIGAFVMEGADGLAGKITTEMDNVSLTTPPVDGINGN